MEEPREGLFLDKKGFIQKQYSSCCCSSILFCTTRERLVGDRVKQVLLGRLHTAIWCLGLHERCDHGLGVKASQITVGLSGTNENDGLARDVGHGDGSTHLPGDKQHHEIQCSPPCVETRLVNLGSVAWNTRRKCRSALCLIIPVSPLQSL